MPLKPQEGPPAAGARDPAPPDAQESVCFRALMRHTTDHVYFKDPASRFVLVSDSMARWLALPSPEAAVGRSDADFFAPEHAQAALRDERDLLEGRRNVVSTEEKETWPDGRVTWVSTVKLPLRDAEGRAVGTFGVSRDITARHEAEAQVEAYRATLERRVAERTAALQESEERHRRMLESVTDYVYEVEIRDGRAVSTRHGPGCEAITGYTPADHARNPLLWIEMVYPDDRDVVRRQSQQVLEGGEPTPLEHRIHRRDGTVRWVRNTPVPRRDAGGRLSGYEGLIKDVTELREAERERLEMERRVLEARQQELLERTDRLSTLGYLAAGVAHEVNNPLQGMLSHLHAVRRATGPAFEARRSLDMLERGIEAIAALANRLLLLGQPAEQEGGATSITDAVQFVRDLVGPQLERSGVSLVLDVRAAYVRVAIPRQELVQALLNLIVNANDATPRGGRVVVSSRREGDAVALSVADTGQGIPRENLPRIFTPFFTTKGGRGTGLGLSIAESLVRSRGGRITVESQVGRGSTFTLVLPLAERKP